MTAGICPVATNAGDGNSEVERLTRSGAVARIRARLPHGAAVAGLLALLLIDLALVGLVLRPRSAYVSTVASPATSSPGTTTTGQSSTVPAPSPSGPSEGATASSPPTAGGGTPSASSSPRGSTEPAPARVLLDFNDDVFLRALPGSCESDEATLERSEDGRLWDKAELPTHAVLALTATSTEVSLIGTDTTCMPEKWVSDDRGVTWRQVAAGGDWYLLPDEPRRVHVPGRSAQSPCRRIIDLAPTSRANASLLCGSGSVYVTSTGGDSWSRGDGVEGAVELRTRRAGSAGRTPGLRGTCW